MVLPGNLLLLRLVCFLLVLSGTGSSAPCQSSRLGEMKSGEVSVIRLAARNHGLRDFELRSRTGPSGRLIVDGFTATLGGGRISGTGHVDFANPSQLHRMQVRLESVDSMAFLKLLEIKLDAVVQARVDGFFELQWHGTGGPDVRRTLSGTAQWTATPGYVAEADAMKMAASVTGVEELRRFEFREAGASGVFTNGVLDVQSLRVSGPDQEVTGTGSLNVYSSQVQIRLQMQVSAELIGKSSVPQLRALAAIARRAKKLSGKKESGADRLVRLPMPLLMTGELQDPRFQFGEWAARPEEKAPAGADGLLEKRSQQ